MPSLQFALRVTVPDEVPAELLAEVDADAQPHDQTQADAYSRWLGGLLSDAAAELADKLPEGFEVRIGGHFHAEPSLQVRRHVYRERQACRAAELRQRADDDDRRAAEGDEQRDYAEERFNADLQREV